MKLIDDEGHVFVGDANEFRKALIKFSVEVGFDYVYKKNELNRVTAECRFKHMAPCDWRIHASRDKSNDHFVIRTYKKVHNCLTNFGVASKKKFNSRVIIDLIAGTC